MSDNAQPTYLISPRSLNQAPELAAAMQQIVQDFPGTRVVRLSEQEALAVLSIPDEMLPGVKKRLADAYIVEPNRSLRY